MKVFHYKTWYFKDDYLKKEFLMRINDTIHNYTRFVFFLRGRGNPFRND